MQCTCRTISATKWKENDLVGQHPAHTPGQSGSYRLSTAAGCPVTQAGHVCLPTHITLPVTTLSLMTPCCDPLPSKGLPVSAAVSRSLCHTQPYSRSPRSHPPQVSVQPAHLNLSNWYRPCLVVGAARDPPIHSNHGPHYPVTSVQVHHWVVQADSSSCTWATVPWRGLRGQWPCIPREGGSCSILPQKVQDSVSSFKNKDIWGTKWGEEVAQDWDVIVQVYVAVYCGRIGP